jgi:type III pantothenate kinase
MLLAIDAGNTDTVLGLYDGEDLVDHWRIATNARRTSDEHVLLIIQFLTNRGSSLKDLTGLVVSSTVPRLTAVLREMATRYLHVAPVVLEPGTRSGMPILYDNPRQVGPDRIANAVGAFDLFGGPTIVVDFGTATTLDATSAAGEYLGGAILPGIEISLDALFDRAAALSWVELVPPRRVIGKSTPESIQSGVLYGTADAVDGLCRRFEEDLGPCTVVSTGGLGHLIAPLSDCVRHHRPWLTLHGLRLIYEMNRDQ